MPDGLFNIAQDSGGNLGVPRQRNRPGSCFDPPRVPPLISPDLVTLLLEEILNVASFRILHTYSIPYHITVCLGRGMHFRVVRWSVPRTVPGVRGRDCSAGSWRGMRDQRNLAADPRALRHRGRGSRGNAGRHAERSGLTPEPGDDPCRGRAGPASSGPGPEAVSSKTRWHPSACRAARWAVKDSCITRSGDGESKPRTLFTGLYQVHKPRSGHNVHNYVTVVLPPPIGSHTLRAGPASGGCHEHHRPNPKIHQ